MLTESSANTDRPFSTIKKGDRVEIYGVGKIRGDNSKNRPIKTFIAHDGTLAFSLRGRVRLNDTSSNNYFTVSKDESVSDGEIKYLESTASDPNKFNDKTLTNVGAVLVYDESGKLKAYSLSEDHKGVIELNKHIKNLKASVTEKYGYAEGDKVKILTCSDAGVKETNMVITEIPSMDSDVYMTLSGDMGDIIVEYEHIEDWVEMGGGVIEYQVNGGRKKLKDVIKVVFYEGDSDNEKIVYSNEKNIEQCNQYSKSKEKRQRYEFILDELLTSLSSEGFVTISTEDDKMFSIKVNSVDSGRVSIITASGDFKKDDLNKNLTISVTDDNPSIQESADSFSVVLELSDTIKIEKISDVEYETDDDEMSPTEMLNLILSDETLRNAFYKQPTLLGFIKSGNPAGIAVAKRVLDKYSPEGKGEKDLSWKDKFKNNRICELVLMSEVKVVKKDNRQPILLGVEYTRLSASIKRSGEFKDVNLRVKNKDGIKFNIKVNKELSRDTYEVSIVMLDGGSIVSYDTTAKIKITDYNKIG